MAETRKFNPAEGDDFAEFIRNAIGDEAPLIPPGFEEIGVSGNDPEVPETVSLTDIPNIELSDET